MALSAACARPNYCHFFYPLTAGRRWLTVQMQKPPFFDERYLLVASFLISAAISLLSSTSAWLWARTSAS
jgi:hypothetical protein